MSLLDRLIYTIEARINEFLGRVSDPGAELDYSYERMQDELQEVNRGVADLATQRKRLEKHRDRLQSNVEKHAQQARDAIRQDREDLASTALEKRRANVDQIADLTEQIEDLQETQTRLLQRRDELETRIGRFRTEKETVKARYEAAQASTRISEALTGVGDEIGDVGRTIERATERTEAMEARAAALEELEESGALDSVLEGGDSIDRELERLSTERQIESDLATLRAELEREDAMGPATSSQDRETRADAETDEPTA